MYYIIIKNLLPFLILLYFGLGRFPTFLPYTKNPIYSSKENYNCAGHFIKFFLYASLSISLYFIDVKNLKGITDYNKDAISLIVLLTFCISIFEAIDNITNLYFIKKSLFYNKLPGKLAKLEKFFSYLFYSCCLILFIFSLIKIYK